MKPRKLGDVAAARNYSPATRLALGYLSRGVCYFPGCSRRIIKFVDNEPHLDVQFAHIRDAKRGNRYDPGMTDEERKAFHNLILLCAPHHEEIDRNHPERYGTELLLEWKIEREGDVRDHLSQGDKLNEENLQEALEDAAVPTIIVSGETIQVGGTGGHRGGGGGGGVIGSGKGGRGGRGPQMVVGDDAKIALDGTPGSGPGAGGGGGGFIGVGSLVPPLGRLPAREGSGFSAGTDGEDGETTSVTFRRPAGDLIVAAPGGKGGLAGSGIRAQSEKIGVSAVLLVRYVEVVSSLAYLAGAAIQGIEIRNLGDSGNLAVFMTLEAGGVPKGEYTIVLQIRDPHGNVTSQQTFPLTVEKPGDIVRVPRFCVMPVTFVSFGLWKVTVSSSNRELAGLDFFVRRTGE